MAPGQPLVHMQPAGTTRHRGRGMVSLPSKELEGNLDFEQEALCYARQLRGLRAARAAEAGNVAEMSDSSSKPRSLADAEPKFLSSACLPAVYAERWSRLRERHRERPLRSPNGPPRHLGAHSAVACCLVEAPTSLLVVINDGQAVEKIPPRTWLVLEPPSTDFEAGGAFELGHFVTSFGTCLLSPAAGGGCIEEQPGMLLLRPVPDSRLHSAAAEANFRRATCGSTATALHHAALASELLAGREPPGADTLSRRIKYAFEPLPPPAGLPMLRLSSPPAVASRPATGAATDRSHSRLQQDDTHFPQAPSTPPPMPQFLKQAQGIPEISQLPREEALGVCEGSSATIGWAEDVFFDDEELQQEDRQESPEEADLGDPRALGDWGPDSRPVTAATALSGAFMRPESTLAARAQKYEVLVQNRVCAAARCSITSGQVRLSMLAGTSLQKEEVIHGKSNLQKGFQALMMFLAFAARRYGNMVRTWFLLDPEANMKIGKRQFERKVLEMGWHGNIPALWKYVDVDGDGIITLLELHPPSALELARFKVLIKERFGDDSKEMFKYLDDNRSRRVSKGAFVQRLKLLSYDGKATKLFDLLDRTGLGMLTHGDVAFLDIWRMPVYIYEKPDFKLWKAVKDKLLEVHQHPLKTWRKLDRDGSMRMSWEEFRDTCGELAWMVSKKDGAPSPIKGIGLPKTEGEAAAAWRAIDQECSGWIALRQFDVKSHDALAEFKSWADRVHGGAVKAFRSLDGTGASGSNAKLSETELKRCTKCKDPCRADIEFLFDGLDVNNNWALTENDLKFLDTWDLAWEEWKYQARITKTHQDGL